MKMLAAELDQTAFIKVARGIEKNTPKTKHASKDKYRKDHHREDEVLLLPEKIIGTNKLPSRN